MNDLKAEFDRHAQDGYLGDPNGEDAYGYLRASTEKQVEEGSSFTRQMENVHKAALRDHLRISLDMIFFDDGFTGFDIDHRMALLRLRHEVTHKPRAHHVVFEDIDRLSRVTWHQCYILDELNIHKVEPHFFINPGSELERYVRGYIAQEGMKKDLERMRMGDVYKAMDGRVNSKRTRYGYVKTHPRNTYYELHPDTSKVVRRIYEMIIYEGKSCLQIADELTSLGIHTPSGGKQWSGSNIYHMVRSTVYKGEYYAQQRQGIKNDKYTEEGRPQRRMKARPKEEWIKVAVPAIVTPEQWQLAQETLKRNAKRATRHNAGHNWLLQGFLKCGTCNRYTMGVMWSNFKKQDFTYYGCNSRQSFIARKARTVCRSPYVRVLELDRRVWDEVVKVIYDPTELLQRLEEREAQNSIPEYQRQLDFIEDQIKQLGVQRQKFENAYNRDIYTLDEFEAKMKDIRAQVQKLENSKGKVQAKMSEVYAVEEQKRTIIKALDKIRKELERAKQENRPPEEIPFPLKRKILSFLVEEIVVDTINKTFTIKGEISGTFAMGDQIANDSAR